MDGPITLSTHPVHLGLGARVVAQPAFTGMTWYQACGERTASDGAEGRLVALHTFDKPWDSWEMHPHGEELVVCLSGTLPLIQEVDGEEVSTRLEVGEAAINPAGVWHTADVERTATALFITAGMGTEGRPR
jgi:mannose-6-phosphate isomerase-like protein (cupin superfamily)